MSYIIDGHCSTCHYCFNECPTRAIRFVGVEYAIDPEKCISCGACAKVCPSGVIRNTGEHERVIPHASQTIDCDLVVLGAGGAGLVAAVRYTQLSGKKVVVLEKARKVGGNTNLGHGFLLRYSKRHAEAGLPDMREEAIKIIGRNGELSMPLLRKALYGLSDMFDWLTEFGDTEEKFKLVNLLEHGQTSMGPFPAMPGFLDFPQRTQNINSTDHSMGPGWAGTFVVEKMTQQCEKLGIQVLTEHRATKLLVDEEGVFHGVVASNPGGEVTVHAKCCLLASGGFPHNKELMKKIRPTFYAGYPVHSFTVASNTGDAIGMVETIGGKLDLDRVKIPMFSPSHHPYSYSLVRMAQDPHMMYINKTGKRFVNESAPPSFAELRGPLENQPDYIGYAIFDAESLEVMGKALLDISADDAGFARCMASWRECLEMECTLDLAARRADTIEELAVLIGVDPAALKEQVAQYNAAAETGIDEQFEKNPAAILPIKTAPFYSLFLTRFNEGAVGGIVNDDNFRVLNSGGSPFAGLYAAGDCCRGLLKADESDGKFGEMPWAMASGYLVAEEMAAYTI